MRCGRARCATLRMRTVGRGRISPAVICPSPRMKRRARSGRRRRARRRPRISPWWSVKLTSRWSELGWRGRSLRAQASRGDPRARPSRRDARRGRSSADTSSWRVHPGHRLAVARVLPVAKHRDAVGDVEDLLEVVADVRRCRRRALAAGARGRAALRSSVSVSAAVGSSMMQHARVVRQRLGDLDELRSATDRLASGVDTEYRCAVEVDRDSAGRHSAIYRPVVVDRADRGGRSRSV